MRKEFHRKSGETEGHVFTGTDSRYGDDAVSRQWVIWHVIERDLHHGGEVSLMPSVHG